MYWLILVLFFVGRIHSQDCEFSINNDLNEPHPLLIRNKKVLYPNERPDIVRIPDKSEFLIVCSKGAVVVNGYTFSDVEVAKCHSGHFVIKNLRSIISEITCTIYPENVAKITGPCGLNNEEITIGFEINKQTFIKQISICFDAEIQSTLYSHFILYPSIFGRQSNFSRPYWINDDFYDLGGNLPNDLYTQKMQLKTINQLLGLPEDSHDFVDPKTNYYLARGHLTAKADLVYGVQQLATFHLINAAPQWQIFNAGNWLAVENDVRDFAIRMNIVLDIYTGTYGVVSLPHSKTGTPVDLYLWNEDQNRGLPVPLLYWKAIYDQKTKSGIVIIGVNNPYIEDISEAIICRDVSDDINWSTWTKNDIFLGYIYACDLEEFAQKVPYFPKLKIHKLLL